MTREEFNKIFKNQFDSKFKLRFEFEDIKNKKSKYRDIHAFMLLEEILKPEKTGSWIISSSDHDVIGLDVDIDQLLLNITEEQVHELMCCGINYDDKEDYLFMFV